MDRAVDVIDIPEANEATRPQTADALRTIQLDLLIFEQRRMNARRQTGECRIELTVGAIFQDLREQPQVDAIDILFGGFSCIDHALSGGSGIALVPRQMHAVRLAPGILRRDAKFIRAFGPRARIEFHRFASSRRAATEHAPARADGGNLCGRRP